MAGDDESKVVFYQIAITTDKYNLISGLSIGNRQEVQRVMQKALEHALVMLQSGKDIRADND